MFEEIKEKLKTAFGEKQAELIAEVIFKSYENIVVTSFNELKETIWKLIEVQKRTEENLNRLTEAQRKTEEELNEFRKATGKILGVCGRL